MKKLKRVLAMLGVIFILGMYALTIYAAFFKKNLTDTFLLTSVVMTLMVPLMVYVAKLIYNLFHRD